MRRIPIKEISRSAIVRICPHGHPRCVELLILDFQDDPLLLCFLQFLEKFHLQFLSYFSIDWDFGGIDITHIWCVSVWLVREQNMLYEGTVIFYIEIKIVKVKLFIVIKIVRNFLSLCEEEPFDVFCVTHWGAGLGFWHFH